MHFMLSPPDRNYWILVMSCGFLLAGTLLLRKFGRWGPPGLANALRTTQTREDAPN